jgi:hypothetical protein
MQFLLWWSNSIAYREKRIHLGLFKTPVHDFRATSLLNLLKHVREEEDDWWKRVKEEIKGK